MALSNIGEWAFLLGVIIAIIVGALAVFVPSMIGPAAADWVIVVLVILGIIIGFLNIKDKETTVFLVAAIALAISWQAFSKLNVLINPLGSLIGQILMYIAIFVAPAAIIVALKAVINLARTKA